jgi:hypothetical protein
MRYSSALFTVALLLLLSGCCSTYYYDLPSRPTNVQGWNKSTFTTVLTIGSFVLNKGESTERDNLGVTFVDLKPARLCKGPLSEPSATQIKLKFYKPSDRRVLCETTIFLPGSSDSGNLDCHGNPELPPGVAIRSYNAKDGWIWLELLSTAGDSRW